MDFSGGACQHSLALECMPSCPLLTALLISPWVSASRPWCATTVYATHPGLPPGPWREHQCGPSAADAPAVVQMPARSATIALGATQLYLSTLWLAWRRALSGVALCQTAWQLPALVRFVGGCQPGPAVVQFADAQLRSRSQCGSSLSCRRSGRPGGERSQLWPSVKLLDSSPRWSGLFAARPPRHRRPSHSLQCVETSLR